MAKGLNVVALEGRLCKDPDLRYLQDGTAVTSFRIANNGYKDTDTLFIKCTCWRKLAEVAGEHLVKGKQVNIVGRLKMEEWEKDGQKQSTYTIDVQDLQFLGKKDEVIEETADGEADM